ncbi:MAG: cytochrome-c oxidase, cbb3-type subunit I [Gammaproteobacteria bacterium]|nr:cytochrome-c oxidase, cbb3-type subunit I [Gammaproteobacteria bacterium]
MGRPLNAIRIVTYGGPPQAAVSLPTDSGDILGAPGATNIENGRGNSSTPGRSRVPDPVLLTNSYRGRPLDTKAQYNDTVVRQFAIMTVVWGVVGMLAGVFIAAQLIWPQLNFDLPFLTYSRLRPLHTNAVIFAFGGSALFATAYYVVQRTCHVRLAFDKLAAFTFWGWQVIIVLAAVTLPLGITQSKEYAELEWPIDLLIAVVWVAFAIVFFMTIARRRVKHIYVANWFYGAFIITVAILHIFNNLAVPVTLTKSYQIYTGTVDAMMQWWYGHNAVGFFLTAGFLGMMYYFVPKQAERPVYSYRLSVVHFWSLIAVYMWAGPHHLHYTSLPDWAQTLGMVFSIILLAPSWGGMINGIMTLSGAWHKLRSDPVLKFMIVALSFYGMSTFEGPMMSIKTVNALSHYTNWTIGHVHSGALGWVAMMTMGSLYCLIPRLYNRKGMYSTKLIDVHFWTSTIGVILYIVPMWVAGVTEGLMWRAVNDDGTLTYSFVESLQAVDPYLVFRLLGGLVFFTGMLIMAFNVWKTVSEQKPAPVAVLDPA